MIIADVFAVKVSFPSSSVRVVVFFFHAAAALHFTPVAAKAREMRKMHNMDMAGVVSRASYSSIELANDDASQYFTFSCAVGLDSNTK